MTITDDIVKTFRDPTPLYAVAGAADLAAEKLREVPPLFGKLRATDPKVVQDRVSAQARDAQNRLNETFAELDLKELRDLRKIGESVQNAALSGVGRAAEAAVRVRETYDELAVRGKGAVATWRGQAADEVVEIAAAVEPEPSEPAGSAGSAASNGSSGSHAAGGSSGSAKAAGPAPAKKSATRKTSTQKKSAE